MCIGVRFTSLGNFLHFQRAYMMKFRFKITGRPFDNRFNAIFLETEERVLLKLAKNDCSQCIEQSKKNMHERPAYWSLNIFPRTPDIWRLRRPCSLNTNLPIAHFIFLAGTPEIATINSSPEGLYRTSYNLTWTVRSRDPLTEVRILFRRLVSHPLFDMHAKGPNLDSTGTFVLDGRLTSLS